MATVTDNTIERGFLVAESQAMRAKLSKIYVPDKHGPNGLRRVYVNFGYPAAEADRRYPMITIDLVDIVPALDRQHSAQIIPVDYWPSEYATFQQYADANSITYDPDTLRAEAMNWVPYNLIFQISTYTKDPMQDLSLSAQLLGTAFLPDRFGYLHVPADQSWRWLDREDWRITNYTEGEGAETQRIFRKTVRVSVSANLPPELPLLNTKVTQINGTIIDMFSNTEMDSWEHTAPDEP